MYVCMYDVVYSAIETEEAKNDQIQSVELSTLIDLIIDFNTTSARLGLFYD